MTNNDKHMKVSSDAVKPMEDQYTEQMDDFVSLRSVVGKRKTIEADVRYRIGRACCGF